MENAADVTTAPVLIATLGSEAQVVTIALDLLRAMGHAIGEVVVVHTRADQEPIRSALARLDGEFNQVRYYGESCSYRTLSFEGPDGPIADTETAEDAGTVFRTLYRLVLGYKRAGRTVHLCAAGGRKTMAMYGMAVAQLLFDEGDHLWHLLSAGRLLDEKRMHPGPGDETALVEVPVLRWSTISPALTELAVREDPYEAIRAQESLRARERRRRVRQFVEGELTPAERDAVRLACQGLTDGEIAERLVKSPRTVGNQLRSAYRKWRAFQGYRRDVRVDRYTLIAELAGYFE